MKIDIAKISLDVRNFRHRNVTTERQAMELLLTDEKVHRVSELAQDIVDMGGLDPSSLLIVTDDPDNEGDFIALEGNRRITALKTLINPEIAAGTPSAGIFKRLSPKFLALNINEVECVVESREQAFNWIKRKHYNAMGGKGVVSWNAIATARSDASEGKFARWMTALAFLEKRGKPDEYLFDGFAGKTTTVERVLGSPAIAAVLGLIFDKKGDVAPENGDEEAAATLIIALLEKMGQPDFTEPKVTTAELQREFIEKFSHLSVKKVAPTASGGSNTGGSQNGGSSAGKGSQSGSAANNSGSANGGSQASAGGSGSKASNASGAKKQSKPVKFRDKLGAPGLRIKNDGMNKLYGELRKLNVEKSPHIASAMNRVFLDKATMLFLDAMAVPCPNPNGWADSTNKLRTKVKAVLDVVDASKKIADLSHARDIANAGRDKIHTLDSLHDAIHNHRSIPSTQEIITVWDRLHPYYLSLFEHLEKNGK